MAPGGPDGRGRWVLIDATGHEVPLAEGAGPRGGAGIMADRSALVTAFEDGQLGGDVLRPPSAENLITPASFLAEHRAELIEQWADIIDEGLNAGIRGGWQGLAQWMVQTFTRQLAAGAASSLATAIVGGNSPAGGGVWGAIGRGVAGLFGIGHNASGTGSWGGGPTLVGETGTEIVIPPQGSRILSHADSRAVMRGGGRQVVQPIFNDFRGAVVTEDLMRAANAAAARAGQAAYAQAMRDAPGMVARRRQEGRL